MRRLVKAGNVLVEAFDLVAFELVKSGMPAQLGKWLHRELTGEDQNSAFDLREDNGLSKLNSLNKCLALLGLLQPAAAPPPIHL